MEEYFDLVSDVNAKKLAWNFKVFIVRICATSNKFNVNEIGSIEMGGRIYATIPRSLVKKYIKNPTFPLEAFRFRNVAKLHTVEKVKDLELFDIIGEVFGKEDPRKLTKRLVVIMENLEKNRLSCTLFGETVDQILPHLDDDQLELLIVQPDGMAKLRCKATLNYPRSMSTQN
ncbi:hypothetical protein Ahy_A10g050508 [Arachis hypogaea]|uniref:DUF223 domain-containing protein n=1 Tax=Arachis hypogaea TaxID=3818 RepID=A0A445B9K0_ARAHY|nr:hypothetical protein Ahy_A10g050508 [Arachis hypogaea]